MISKSATASLMAAGIHTPCRGYEYQGSLAEPVHRAGQRPDPLARAPE